MLLDSGRLAASVGRKEPDSKALVDIGRNCERGAEVDSGDDIDMSMGDEKALPVDDLNGPSRAMISSDSKDQYRSATR